MNEEKNVYEQSILLEPDNQVQVISIFIINFIKILNNLFKKRKKKRFSRGCFWMICLELIVILTILILIFLLYYLTGILLNKTPKYSCFKMIYKLKFAIKLIKNKIKQLRWHHLLSQTWSLI